MMVPMLVPALFMKIPSSAVPPVKVLFDMVRSEMVLILLARSAPAKYIPRQEPAPLLVTELLVILILERVSAVLFAKTSILVDAEPVDLFMIEVLLLVKETLSIIPRLELFKRSKEVDKPGLL